ncbi:MAG: hypothetical protein ACREM9_04895 [Gemmatimonadales bacterium]
MGCITAPFKLLGCLGLIVLLVVGYLYRDRLEQEGRRLIERIQGIAPSSSGRPGVSSLESATAKVDSLNGWRADSVVLTASEFASLVGNGMDRQLRSQLDSLQIELLEGEIQVNARLRTDMLPPEIIGPLSGALRPTEPVQAAGPVRVTRPGAGEWRVRTFRIGDFPVPDEMVPGLVGRALGDPRRKAVPVTVPEGVRAIRVRPGGATLYGATRS